MFIRIKRFRKKNGNILEYAYLVENKRNKKKKNGCKQKVKAYIGRVHTFQPVNDLDFFSYHEIKDIDEYARNRELKGITRDLIGWELFKHDIDDVFFNEDKLKVSYKGKDVALKVNDGILCNHTIKKIVEFKINPDSEIGYDLAKAFVDAGIKVPEELFVKIFEKITQGI